jgi:RNA polymerase sigma-70 factor, ECF subfamily
MFDVYRRNPSVGNDVPVMGRIARLDAIAAANGDDFVDMYRHAVGAVYSYLASRLGDSATAEDLTQEVFIVGAHRALAGDPVDVAWLIAVARHKLIDHWRARSREERHLARVYEATTEPVPELPQHLDPGRASAALASINPTYRAALVLRHVDGLSVPAVAAEIARSVAATEQILTRARVAFRTAYQGEL